MPDHQGNQPRDERDEISVLKDAIAELESSIAEVQSEDSEAVEEDASSAASSVSRGDVADEDLEALDSTPSHRGATIPDYDDTKESQAQRAFEELGKASIHDRAVRGPLIKQALAKSWRRSWRKRTIGGSPVDIRRTKLSMSNAAAAANQAADDDDEVLVSRSKRIGFEEERPEIDDLNQPANRRELRTAILISRVVAGLVFLGVLTAVFALANRKSQEEETAAVSPIEDWADQHQLVASAQDTIASYALAKTIGGRAQHVNDAERVRPLMERYYRNHPLPKSDEPPLTSIVSNRSQHIHSEVPDSHVLGGYQDHVGFAQELVLVPGKERYLVDWEASVGYNEQSLSELITLRPDKTYRMRLQVMPANYYNFQFDDRLRYQSFVVKVADDSEARRYAYVTRKSKAFQDLMDHFANRDPRPIAMILDVRFPDGEDPVVEILNVHQPHWVHSGPLAPPK